MRSLSGPRGRNIASCRKGPEVTPADWERTLAAVAALDFDWLVASGSLPRGLPADAYGALGRLAAERGARFVLDTSGPALMGALTAGPAHLIKPSFGEFRALTGAASDADADIAPAAERLRAERGVEMVAVTLGPDGAALAWPAGSAPQAAEAACAGERHGRG
jgi:6-phosphofructokinase 2